MGPTPYQPTKTDWRPQRKVWAGALASAITAALGMIPGLDVGAFQGVISFAAFLLVAYLVPNPK